MKTETNGLEVKITVKRSSIEMKSSSRTRKGNIRVHDFRQRIVLSEFTMDGFRSTYNNRVEEFKKYKVKVSEGSSVG